MRSSMRKYWAEHSKAATIEEMMLDSHAQIIAVEEQPEIIDMLPDIDGKTILELGAGIGRFTDHFATVGNNVTAVDFMKTFLDRNREQNNHHANISYIQSDVMQLELQKNSFDLIFSNWLFMYLSDAEIVRLTQRMLEWLKPGGFLFFRESCFYQSGDSKRFFNPTVYRKPAAYNLLLTSVVQETAGLENKSYGFEIVMSKCVQTYIKVKRNQNQVCWLLQKLPRNPSANQGYGTFQQFLDNHQYSRRGILRYEKIFGQGFVSTGGQETTKEFLALLNLQPGQKVLDVGCGIGGGDIYMAKAYGVEVLGIDLSSNMVEIAMERTVDEDVPLVQYEIGDATKRVFPEHSFDVIYSRDTILHISDKFALFQKFYSWLKPGGKLLISDYCCGEKQWSNGYKEYVKERGYILYSTEEYGEFLQKARFVNVRAMDRTAQFVDILKKELQKTESIKDEFIQEFSEEDYLYIVNGWKRKLQHCELGDQRWGLFYAEKPKNEQG
ncbi:phosphomethylethanolamine N-methyltransferase-like isoform X2 [Protopterus annectens]|nr:phosphomethylethanolamine N-methyltransferase-like isoform X2 [Protopterus annectens]XP_043931613.1 phosphomethylethanolamine N-methyltransferase-like isoform X2 [Protopterus annectens]